MDNKIFHYWQTRILVAMMFGYAGFYLIRNNISIAIPYLRHEFGYTCAEIGLITTISHTIYGLGKGVSGVISDRSNARYFMSAGLFFSCLANLFMGLSSTLSMFTCFWAINAIFQSMGWPPCAKLLTHWFTRKEIATKWAFWNMSQQIGMLLMYALTSFASLLEKLSSRYELYISTWQFVFFLPAIIALGLSIFVFLRLRDTPESLGFPSVRIDEDREIENISFHALLLQKVFKNPLIWFVCAANFFLYFVRYSIVTWFFMLFLELKNNTNLISLIQTASYEITGMIGGLLAGYISDKIFHGERGMVGALCMIGVSVSLMLIWILPPGTPTLQIFIMMLLGFFMSGPQILIGVAATDYASKKAAGAASGLTGIFGYIGSALSGIGSGWIIDQYGWDSFFMVVLGASVLSGILLFITWKKRAKKTA